MRRPLALLCAPLSAVVLAACGSAVSTSSFKGEKHAVAQTIADYQSDATAGEEKKICANDVAAVLVSRLGGVKGCEKAFHDQLQEADNLELTVESVSVSAASATAQVKSTYSGKKRLSTLSLVKEGKRWRISALG